MFGTERDAILQRAKWAEAADTDFWFIETSRKTTVRIIEDPQDDQNADHVYS